MVKNPPAMWETWVPSLGWEDPLEESMGTHSSILAWRIPLDRGAWEATVHGVCKESDTTERLSTVAEIPSLLFCLLLGYNPPIICKCSAVMGGGRWILLTFDT